jgi:hypothetical protein
VIVGIHCFLRPKPFRPFYLSLHVILMIFRFFSQLDYLHDQILIKTGQKKIEPNIRIDSEQEPDAFPTRRQLRGPVCACRCPVEIIYSKSDQVIRLLFGHCQHLHMNAGTQIEPVKERSCALCALGLSGIGSDTNRKVIAYAFFFFPRTRVTRRSRIYTFRANGCTFKDPFFFTSGRTHGRVCSAVRRKPSFELRAFLRRPWREQSKHVRLNYRFWYSVRLLIKRTDAPPLTVKSKPV